MYVWYLKRSMVPIRSCSVDDHLLVCNAPMRI